MKKITTTRALHLSIPLKQSSQHQLAEKSLDPRELLPSSEHKDILQKLFPKSKPFSHKIRSTKVEVSASSLVFSKEKCSNILAIVFANIETGKLIEAEQLFQKTLRTSRAVFISLINIRVIHKFLTVNLLCIHLF